MVSEPRVGAAGLVRLSTPNPLAVTTAALVAVVGEKDMPPLPKSSKPKYPPLPESTMLVASVSVPETLAAEVPRPVTTATVLSSASISRPT